MGRKPSVMPRMRFGRLTVLSDSGERSGGSVIWTCRCDCGREVKLRFRDLLRNRVRDCGCTEVCFRKPSAGWGARVGWEKRSCDPGSFRRKEDAVRARNYAEDRTHNRFMEWYNDESPAALKAGARPVRQIQAGG